MCKYKKECAKSKTEQQFIKHGDTFFNKAILDYVTKKTTESKKTSKEQYKEIEMTEDEYNQRMNEGGKKYD